MGNKNNYRDRFKKIDPATRALVKRNLDILDRIHYLLEDKFDGKQKLLADKMGKSEAEVSKMLNGFQNFTQKTIIKLEAAFESAIIAVCTESEVNSTFKLVKPHTYLPQENFSISIAGELTDNISLEKENITLQNI